MTGPDVTGVGEYAEKAARDAVALRVEERTLALADELCADHRADHPLDHCQECYDLACTVSDSSWLAASLEATRVEERERIAEALTTCSCGCDVTNHYTVCSTYGCPCRLDRDRAQLVAADHAARIARGEAT